MKQLLLDLNTEKSPSLESFAVGKNAELVQLLSAFSQRIASQYGERFVYLWGGEGSGKTHLLHALASSGEARYIAHDAGEAAFTHSPEISLYLIDDCENSRRQHKLMHLPCLMKPVRMTAFWWRQVIIHR